jgi:hypothetical protein
MLDSPLAAASRARVHHQRTRQRPPERGLRVVAAAGALLLHLVFLFAFVLGPAYQVKPPPESKESFLQVRLIEPPEPPPPPPVRGTPPKERGPRHQGHVRTPVSNNTRSETTRIAVAATPAPAAATPVVAAAAKPHASVPKPAAAPPPAARLPQPAPTPDLQPVPLAGEPPALSLPTPTLQPPVPPAFQPESVRRPQLEGTRPLPPPASLALPELPAQAPPPITVTSIALHTEPAKSAAPASVNPVRADIPAAPPVPELQPIPLPAQPSPNVDLRTTLSPPAPTVPREQPQVQAPAVDAVEAELESVPLAPAAPAQVHAQAPAVKIAIDTSALKPAVQTSIERPQASAPPVVAQVPAPIATPIATSRPSPPATAEQPAPGETPASPAETGEKDDVSRAPEATPQGSDNATPGQPEGVVAAPEDSGKNIAAAQPATKQGGDKGSHATPSATGQIGGNQPGAAQGAKQGELGSYVQLRPHGDTQVMNHGTPNIGYKPTRFDQDWAPQGESSIDTALRHAVEKTTVKHTFHLPRGVRIECGVVPLLPMALLGCHNPDPPPKPVDAKVYDRLHLAPANPLATPASATSSVAPASMIKVDNSAECAAARIAGGPPPPGCEDSVLPVRPAIKPASSSSSWVPASDQFH